MEARDSSLEVVWRAGLEIFIPEGVLVQCTFLLYLIIDLSSLNFYI